MQEERMDSTITTQDDPTQRMPALDPAVPFSTAASATGQLCTNCGATLAADQRYCLECGERHGEPRLPVMSGRPDPAATTITSTTLGGGSRLGRRGASANTALIAGVGTLLVALGVGVLIGRTSDAPEPQKASGVQVVTVAGAAGPAVAGATPSSSTPSSTTTAGATDASAKDDNKSKSGKKDGGDAKDASTSAVDAAGAGGTVKKSSGKVVKIGTKGSGKGYKNGKFTGDFFGGG
jgi:hypothetical protein